jgi:gliding motility-associated-like protein
MYFQKISLAIIFIFTVTICSAQLPQCNGIDSNKIFLISSGDVYRFDPILPVSATNPAFFCNLGNSNYGSLTISNNLNGGAASPTFYSMNIGGVIYEYWDGATMVNTGHTAGAVNPGGGIANIYSYLGGNNEIWKYQGTGNATFLTTVAGAGPYDLVTDINDNFMFYDANTAPGTIRKYSPLGVIIDSYSVTSPVTSSAGGGFAMTGNTVFASYGGSDIYLGTLIAGSVTLAFMGNATITIQDVAQCPAAVTTPGVFDVTFTAPDTICDGSCATITNTSIGNIVSWDWYFQGGTPSTSSLMNPGPVCYANSGTYLIQLIGTDSLGMKDTFTKNITIGLNPVLNIIPSEVYRCTPGDTIHLTATGSVATTYAWQPNATLGCIICQTAIANPTVTTSYYLAASDNYGCTSKDTVKVNILPLQAIMLVPITEFCLGANLTATNLSTGAGVQPPLWLLGNGASIANNNFINYQYPAGGTYNLQLIVSDTLGCVDTTSKQIIVEDPGYVNFNITDSIICVGTAIYIKDTFSIPVNSFNWNFGDNSGLVYNLHDPLHTYETSVMNGQITLQVQYKYCPTLNISHTLNVFDYPIVNLGPDSSICPGLTAPLTLKDLNNNSNYLWNTGSVANALPITEAGTYWLQASNDECKNADTILIKRDCYINIPNSFTPNGDGLNDYFMPMDLMSAGVTTFSMNIFNRWGEIIFTTNNLNSRGWDGKFGGKPQPLGVYVYTIDVVFKNGEQKKYNGNVTLLR